MRLVSYNVRYFGHGLKGLGATAGSKQAIASSLVSLAPLPDLIALQEVETRSIRAGFAHRGAHPSETQLEAFLRYVELEFKRRGMVMPYQAWYFPAHVYQLGPIKLYTTGLAILVNARTVNVVRDNGDKPHHITHYRSKIFRQVKQTRIAAHLHLEDAHGKPFHLFNTHLSLPTLWTPEVWTGQGRMGFGPNQLAEARALHSYIETTARNEPFVLVGDFNTAPGSPVYQSLCKDACLRGAQEELKQIDPTDADGFPTAGFLNLRMHLDHIFAGPNIEFVDLNDTRKFGDESSPFHELSDHVPLITQFDVK